MTKNINNFIFKKRIRKNYSKLPCILPIPNLLTTQHNSYKLFFTDSDLYQNNINYIFKSYFPMSNNDKNINLIFINYKIEDCIFNVLECQMRGLSYTGSLKAIFRLEISDINKINTIKYTEQEVYLGEIPLMTKKGTFIINGTERIIVSQLNRSPGVFFNIDKNKSSLSNKILYNAKIIPVKGSWLSFEFDIKDLLFVKIERKKKILVTLLLKALKLNNEQILSNFYDLETFYFKNNKIILKLIPSRLKGQISPFNIINKNITYVNKGKIITNKDILLLQNNNINYVEVEKEYLINKIIAKNYINYKTGELICSANTKLNIDLINKLIINNINMIEILFINNLDHVDYISRTLKYDNVNNYVTALEMLYHYLNPNEEFTVIKAQNYLHKLFFYKDIYNLSIVGRKKINQSLLKSFPANKLTLTRLDIIQVLRKLINIKNGIEYIDEIDHLGNRRIKSLAEILSYYLKLGLSRLEKILKEQLNEFNYKKNLNKYKLQDLFNSKIISIVIKEFFTTSQLSQFMDQTNPLSEITHKRRISCFGPGGLNRDRAGFEIRDIHFSHYGRMCPVETPEGPNIGLITSLSLYAKINKYGFIVTPYLKVINNKITNEINYLSADEEKIYHIAQANTYRTKDLFYLDDKKLHSCRFNGEIILVYSKEIQYIDISSLQLVSIGTSLIPFVEHDDANRALMGTNMQRQAVPLIRKEKPLVGTGIEEIVAKDSGLIIFAKRGGIISYLDSTKIIVKVNYKEINKYNKEDIGYDIYYLLKYYRTNQNTYINQRPCVNLLEKIKSGDLLVDTNATDLGELAIGQNVRIAFMSWYGYNYEDSIMVSDELIKEDKFTSIHIEEFTCIVRDTKLGYEKLTNDLPNINIKDILNLDEEGIINIGTRVKENDILVGKVTPIGDVQLAPEEKLLYAIFGEKVSNYKDTSLRVPLGTEGTVIDIQICYKEGLQNERKKLIFKKKIVNKAKEKLTDEFKLLKNEIIYNIEKILIKEKYPISFIQKDFYNNKLNNLKLNDMNNEIKLTTLLSKYESLKYQYNKNLKLKLKQININNDLAPGILKLVKIFIASKRQLKAGDKMSGRHGNKGVVSKICFKEDMPYDESGIPIDIILNPLGVPSRMNVGQILETHLGLAAKGIGNIINNMINNQYKITKLKNFLHEIYNLEDNLQQKIDLNTFTDDEIITLAKNLCDGLPVATPVFDGAKEKEIKSLLKLAKKPYTGKIILFDGCTGERIKQKVTVGYMYMLKLNHLVDDKIHARSTGSYSLITQQPLGGKSQFGGQRFGEMEVWALEAYGAAHILQEILTVKSDDVIGRTKMYQNIINENYFMSTGIPESFNVLINEIKSLGLNIKFIKPEHLKNEYNNKY